MKKVNTLTAVYCLIFSILLLFIPLLTLGSIVSDVATEGSSSTGIDTFVRVMAGGMVVLSLVMLIKDRVASTAGKILILIAGAIVIMFSSLLGFPAGVIGIVGASLLLASNKKYKKL